ncbi:MAG: phage head closure protein [Gemmataceae bacterium]
MDAGKLDQRVTLESPPDADGERNEIGEVVGDWNPIGTFWAEVLSLSGSEAVEGDMIGATTVYRVTMRYRSDVTEAWRILWNGLDLRIESVGRPEGNRSGTMTIIAAAAKDA